MEKGVHLKHKLLEDKGIISHLYSTYTQSINLNNYSRKLSSGSIFINNLCNCTSRGELPCPLFLVWITVWIIHSCPTESSPQWLNFQWQRNKEGGWGRGCVPSDFQMSTVLLYYALEYSCNKYCNLIGHSEVIETYNLSYLRLIPIDSQGSH